jgi:hypothetical protein
VLVLGINGVNGVDGVVGVVVAVEGVVVVLVAVEVVVVVFVLWVLQSLTASWPTVLAPWRRLLTSVVLTVLGRLSTALLNDVAALVAAPHCPELTAVET